MLVRSDTNTDSLTDRSVYTFPMQRRDCRTARTGERVCNYRQFDFVYTYDYGIPAAPESELGHVIGLTLAKTHDAPPFQAPGPLNCPPSYHHGEYYEIDGGTRWRPATAGECPYGIGTRQCEQRVWNEYYCNDGVADITGSATYEDTGTCTGACTPQPCSLPWGGQIASGQSVTAYYQSSVSCGGSCYAETRTCNAGTLSGSYGAPSCSMQTCYTWQVCMMPCETTGGGGLQYGDRSYVDARNVDICSVQDISAGDNCTTPGAECRYVNNRVSIFRCQ